MINDEELRVRIRRHYQRKSKNVQVYYANQHGHDLIIWRSICALYTQARIEKDSKRFLKVRDIIWLIAIKQLVVSTGKDNFTKRGTRKFMAENMKVQFSMLTALTVFESLDRAGYIVRYDKTRPREGWVLTMKARAFYRDINSLFKI